MKALPSSFIAEVVARTPLAALIGRHVKLVRSGATLSGCCPFHADDAPSFHVYPDGHFRCYGCGEHGDAISFVRRTDGLSFPGAVERLAADAGLPMPDGWRNGINCHAVIPDPEEEARAAAKEAAERAAKKDVVDRIALARKHATQAVPVQGTPAEIYLINKRDIVRPDRGWPSCVRFHRASCSLLLVGTTDAGKVQCVQRVFLTLDGRRTSRRKITNGVVGAAPCRLPSDDPAGPLVICEGPETGLSLWTAAGAETWITFGKRNLAKAPVPEARRHIIVARDDDPDDVEVDEAVKAFRARGHHVRIGTPWQDRRLDGSDFNDTIKEGGIEAVAARVSVARWPDGRPRLSAEKARPALERAIADFLLEFALYDSASGRAPPVHALLVEVGAGKSSIARKLLIQLLVDMRARGDMRTVIIAVPYHRLSTEAAREFEREAARVGAKLTAAIWRGRQAADPSAPGEDMCRKNDQVRDARTAGANVAKACCKGTTPEGEPVTCDLHSICGYQNQPKRADVWYVAHEMVFSPLPTNLGKPALLVVDEDCSGAGLEGVDGRPIALGLDTFDVADRIPRDRIATDRLHFLRQRALDALRATADGPVLRAKLIEHGLTTEAARETRGLEWNLKVEPRMHPRQTAAEKKPALHEAAINRTVRKRSMFWSAIEASLTVDGPERSGWVKLATESDENGARRVVHLKHRREVTKGLRIPTIVTDALLNMTIIRHFWPQAELKADIRIEAPHQRIRQSNRPYSQRKLINDPAYDGPDDLDRKIKARRRLHAIVHREARRTNGRVLVIMQQKLEAALKEELAHLPASVVTAHHNDVAGRDEWRDVRLLIIVGRTMPKRWDAARIAEALTGRAVEDIEGRMAYPRREAMREMGDGSFLPVEVDYHPDPAVEAVRWQISEGNTVNGIGRGRGINRKAANPLDVLVLTDVLLPMPVDEMIDDSDLDPSPADMMLAAGGVKFEGGRLAHAAYPDLWPTVVGAQKAIERWATRTTEVRRRLHTKPCTRVPIRECMQPRLLRCEFQPVGMGRKPAVAWCDPERVQDPRTRIEELLGVPLAWCEHEDPEVVVDEEPVIHDQAQDVPTHIVSSITAMATEFTSVAVL